MNNYVLFDDVSKNNELDSKLLQSKLIELESTGKIARDDQYYNEKDYVNPNGN